MKDFLSIIHAWAGILLHTIPGQMLLYLTLAALIVWGGVAVVGWLPEEDTFVIKMKTEQAPVEINPAKIMWTVEEDK
jgi:hypothetical protein